MSSTIPFCTLPPQASTWEIQQQNAKSSKPNLIHKLALSLIFAVGSLLFSLATMHIPQSLNFMKVISPVRFQAREEPHCENIRDKVISSSFKPSLPPLSPIADDGLLLQADDEPPIPVRDPCELLPPELINVIFSFSSFREIGVNIRVSKQWSISANDPAVWESAIYREIAFSSKNWAQLDADLVKDEDIEQEILSLPKKEDLRRLAFPGKSIRKTHMLVRMPKGLTLKKLGDLAKKYFPRNVHGYRYQSELIDELDNQPVDKSVWLFMTTDVIEGTRHRRYKSQQKILTDLATTTEVPYEVPGALEAATCIFSEYTRSGKRRFNDRPFTYTHCREKVQGFQIRVGAFTPEGFSIDNDDYDSEYPYPSVGVAALRKF